MGQQDYYSIRVFFKCRQVILSSDPDCIVFVNNENNRWLDGAPLSTEDMLGLLEYFGQDMLKPPEERAFRHLITFCDGEGMYYGSWVRFDEEGHPLVKVVNDKIYATNIVPRFELDGAGEAEPSIEGLYGLLARAFDVGWVSDAHEDFFVYFLGRNGKYYRLYVSADYVDIACRRPWLGWDRWESFSHEHHDVDEDDVMTVYESVKYYLQRYAR